jgi:hypothetical protein
VQDTLEEKLSAIEWGSGNVEVQWNNIKKSVPDTMSDKIGQLDRKARKPWITQKVINKMYEQRIQKSVNNEGRKNYRTVSNELERAKNKAKKVYVGSICDEVMEFDRTECYDLLSMKMKKLGWKKSHMCQNIGNEDSKWNIRVYKRQVLKVWVNYIIELLDRCNWSENLDVKPEEEVDADEKDHYIL